MAKAFIFGIEDVLTNLGLSTLVANSTTLEPQGFSPAINSTIASAMGNFGDILIDGSTLQAMTAYDVKQNFSITLVTKQDANSGVTIKLGGAGATMIAPYKAAVATGVNFGLYSKFVLTGLSLAQPAAGFAKISLTGHAHFFHATTGTPNEHIARVYTIVIPTFGFGVQQLPLSCASSAPTLTLADFTNYGFEASIQHTDELDRSGKFLIGASYGANIKENFTFQSYNDGTFGHAIQGDVFTPATNWKVTSQPRNPSNTGYENMSVSAETFQVADA